MGRISHFVRRRMRPLSGGRRATGGICNRERGEDKLDDQKEKTEQKKRFRDKNEDRVG